MKGRRKLLALQLRGRLRLLQQPELCTGSRSGEEVCRALSTHTSLLRGDNATVHSEEGTW